MLKYILIPIVMAVVSYGLYHIGYEVADGKCSAGKVVVADTIITKSEKANAARTKVDSDSYHGVIPDSVLGFYID